MNNSLLLPLEAVLTQSQTLLTLAHEQNWDAFDMLVQQRQAGMTKLADGSYLLALTDAGLDVEAKNIVTQILEINKMLSDLAITKRDEVATEIRQSLLADKARNAYGR